MYQLATLCTLIAFAAIVDNNLLLISLSPYVNNIFEEKYHKVHSIVNSLLIRMIVYRIVNFVIFSKNSTGGTQKNNKFFFDKATTQL